MCAAEARRLRRNTSSRTGCAWHQSQAASDRNNSAIGPCANPDLHERRQIGRKWANRQIGQKSFDACVSVYGARATESGRRSLTEERVSVAFPLQTDFDGDKRIGRPSLRSPFTFRKTLTVVARASGRWHVARRPDYAGGPNSRPIRSRVPQAVGLANTSPAANPAAIPCCTANARKWSRYWAFVGGNWLA